MNKEKKVILNHSNEEKHLHDKIYEFLENNAVGYEKRVKSSVLMNKFNINDNKTFRSQIEMIRNDENFQKIICSEAGQSGGYWIATSQEEVYTTLEHLYKRSMVMLKTYSILKRKSKLNGQMKLKLNEVEEELYRSIMEG